MSDYHPTHVSKYDDSPIMLLHKISDTEGAFMNENGDVFPDLLADWQPLPTEPPQGDGTPHELGRYQVPQVNWFDDSLIDAATLAARINGTVIDTTTGQCVAQYDHATWYDGPVDPDEYVDEDVKRGDR